MSYWRTALLLAVLGAGACDFDQPVNPNSPSPIDENPTRGQISAAANGMLVALRPDIGDIPIDVGIMGREVLRFDGSDPRFTRELLIGPNLDPGGDPFGGDHWAEEYNAIREGNLLLSVLPGATQITDPQRSATAGYVKTIQAWAFLIVVSTHTEDSIPLDPPLVVTDPLAPMVSNAAAYDRIVALLDGAKADLQATDAAFPFSLPSGFAGFNTPTTFLRFNRALRARVAAYRQDWAGVLAALSESFLTDGGPLDLGVYMNFGTGAGDITNPLAVSATSSENYAHPQLDTLAQLQVDGVTKDARFVGKVVARAPSAVVDGFQSSLGLARYSDPSTSIPIIKNEELILLRAEANIGLGALDLALTDLNTIRQTSGGLPPVGPFADATAAVDELLYNRLFSLLYEGGYRWIDLRRYGRLALASAGGDLPLSRTGSETAEAVYQTYPIPSDESNQR
jgi:starch-binding outer membrane protein, SusD/RagB family